MVARASTGRRVSRGSVEYQAWRGQRAGWGHQELQDLRASGDLQDPGGAKAQQGYKVSIDMLLLIIKYTLKILAI